MDELPPVRNYKFRLYPTAMQKQRLLETLDGCRWVYNYFVGKNMSRQDMQFALTELKEAEPFLRNYHSKMLQMVVHKIDVAHRALRALRRNGHRIGKLHYLTDEEYSSFTYNQSGFKISNSELWLSKIGRIRIKLHRQPINIKQVTVKQRNSKWYAVVACEFAKPLFRFINPARSIGIDVGITKFSHDSENHIVENPLFLRQMLKPLRRANRTLSCRQKGSNNWKKAKSRLQRLHERIRNKRNDFLHKTSSYYSKRFDIVFLERLQVLNMIKNFHLARSIIDSGWSTFKQMLQYKVNIVLEVSAAYTSIKCSRCNHQVPKVLAVRTHHCGMCGLAIDRDFNSSLNVKQDGLKLLPVERREVTPAEILNDSLKQELRIPVFDR